MKFDDFKTKDILNFDVASDVLTYMRNHPTFYRKEYFPTMAVISDRMLETEVDTSKELLPMVKKGCEQYGNEYGIGEVFTNEDYHAIIAMIIEQEGEDLAKGDY